MRVFYNLIIAVLFCSCYGNTVDNSVNENDSKDKTKVMKPKLELEVFNAGKFSIKKPKGWEVEYRGDCTNLSFVIYDPNDPNTMVSYVGELGPVYLSQYAKQFDYEKIYFWGMNVEYFEMPLIIPFNPQNLVLMLPQICNTNYMSKQVKYFPRFELMQIINIRNLPPVIFNSVLQEMRVVFTSGSANYEAIIGTSTWCFDESFGWALSTYCLSAKSEDFIEIITYLFEILSSFTYDEAYYNNCMASINATNQRIANQPNTLKSVSNGMAGRWKSRDETDDIIAAKRSDAMLNYERLYDPETGDVYRVQQDFYENYKSTENNFRMNKLKPIPDNNHTLWTKPALTEKDIR